MKGFLDNVVATRREQMFNGITEEMLSGTPPPDLKCACGAPLGKKNRTGACMRCSNRLTDRDCTRGCGRKLGARNRSGVCTTCQLTPKTERRRPPQVRIDVTAPVVAPRPLVVTLPAPVGPALARMRGAAIAFGLDPDAILERFAEQWLASAKARLEAL